MIAGFFIVYPLFVRNIAALSSKAAVRQLSAGMPVWLSDEAERTAWREEKSRQFDQFNRLASITMLPVTVEFLAGRQPTPADRCQILAGLPEHELLTSIWAEFSRIRQLGMNIAGWGIREQCWPRLLNRSLCLGVPIPDWAKPNLARKWMDVELDDLSMMYSCGIYEKVRPLPRLNDALSFWLQREFTDEDMVLLQAEVKPDDPAILTATCEYVRGLAEVLHRYLRKEA
jgi:hypothetical protein